MAIPILINGYEVFFITRLSRNMLSVSKVSIARPAITVESQSILRHANGGENDDDDEEEGLSAFLFSPVSFDLKPGSLCILQGPSGAGKTTLLKIIAKLVHSDIGTILLHGKPPKAYGIPYW